MDAVFKSELFCQLTDGQLTALHYRSQQFEEQRQAALQRERRRRWMIAAAIAVLAATAPFWQVALALSFIVFLWAVALSVVLDVWDRLQRLRNR